MGVSEPFAYHVESGRVFRLPQRRAPRHPWANARPRWLNGQEKGVDPKSSTALAVNNWGSAKALRMRWSVQHEDRAKLFWTLGPLYDDIQRGLGGENKFMCRFLSCGSCFADPVLASEIEHPLNGYNRVLSDRGVNQDLLIAIAKHAL